MFIAVILSIAATINWEQGTDKSETIKLLQKHRNNLWATSIQELDQTSILLSLQATSDDGHPITVTFLHAGLIYRDRNAGKNEIKGALPHHKSLPDFIEKLSQNGFRSITPSELTSLIELNPSFQEIWAKEIHRKDLSARRYYSPAIYALGYARLRNDGSFAVPVSYFESRKVNSYSYSSNQDKRIEKMVRKDVPVQIWNDGYLYVEIWGSEQLIAVTALK